MRNPPRDLAEQDLSAALAEQWSLEAVTLEYRPVGFGSHHWQVVDTRARNWFASVDDLDVRRTWSDESRSEVLRRLGSSFLTATRLRESGLGFVAAPIPAHSRAPLVPLGERFAVRLDPFLDGRSFEWGGYEDVDHRAAVFAMVVAVHTSHRETWRDARHDNYEIQFRKELEAALDGAAVEPSAGPFTERASTLIAASATPIRRALARYEELVAVARTESARDVLTHGEPHAANTMLTDQGWKLIDWDTVLVAPPERDLWMVDPGDGSTFDTYREATGVQPLPSMIELYQLQWDLAETALYGHQFRTPHQGDANDDVAWRGLTETIEEIATGRSSGVSPRSG